MNSGEWKNFHDSKFQELPPAVIELADLIFEATAPEGRRPLLELYIESGGEPSWFMDAFGHHGGGTSVRNVLRQNKLTDDLVPSGNLDDYYTVPLEHWIGVRK